MYGTLGRFRFYLWCDSSSLEVDYAPPLQDYPEYPRDEGIAFFGDKYKSALGSNYWYYRRGESQYINFNWVDVSDDCVATMGIICGSSFSLLPHVAIWEGPGIDGITLGSLQTITGTVLKGTFMLDNERWDPQETVFGNWTFKTNFIRVG